MKYKVEDHSKYNSTLVKMTTEDFKQIVFDTSAYRSMITQEDELRQLDQLEEILFEKIETDFNLSKTRKIIKILDQISPDRKNCGTLLGWQGFYKTEIRSPYGLFSDLVHITSSYFPNLVKDWFIKIEGRKLSDQSLRRRTRKGRTTKPNFPSDSEIWSEIFAQIGYEYLEQPIRPDLYDSFLTIQQLGHYYYTLIESVIKKDTSLSNEEMQLKIVRLGHISIICGLYDVFKIKVGEFENNPKSIINKKFNKDDLTLINDFGGFLSKEMMEVRGSA